MRANSMGPPCSAALGRSSAAVSTAGEPRSAAGTGLTRGAIAWRQVASLTPSASTIGSANRRDQDTNATPQRNRDSSRRGVVDSGRSPLPHRETAPAARGAGAVLLGGYAGGQPSMTVLCARNPPTPVNSILERLTSFWPAPYRPA